MTSFIAIYRGNTVADARLVAVSADPNLVLEVSQRLLEKQPAGYCDPVLDRLEGGKRAALRLIEQEAQHEDEGR